MITDKNGKKIELKDILKYLVGTDELDEAKSVIDFSLYKIKEDKTLDDPTFYLVASETIVTQISFMGPFVMMELDFRNVGIQILQQVMNVVHEFHTDINSDNLLLLSTITSLDEEATHIMSLANPLTCIRGYSDKGEGTTLLQMIYSVDNVGFSTHDIDYSKIDADVDREIAELEAMEVTEEEVAAAQEIYDNNNEAMKEMFTPEFGLRTPESKMKERTKDVRVSGEKAVKIHSSSVDNADGSDNVRITNTHGNEED